MTPPVCLSRRLIARAVVKLYVAARPAPLTMWFRPFRRTVRRSAFTRVISGGVLRRLYRPLLRRRAAQADIRARLASRAGLDRGRPGSGVCLGLPDQKQPLPSADGRRTADTVTDWRRPRRVTGHCRARKPDGVRPADLRRQHLAAHSRRDSSRVGLCEADVPRRAMKPDRSFRRDGKRVSISFAFRRARPRFWTCDRDGRNQLQLTALGHPLTGTPRSVSRTADRSHSTPESGTRRISTWLTLMVAGRGASRPTRRKTPLRSRSARWAMGLTLRAIAPDATRCGKARRTAEKRSR